MRTDRERIITIWILFFMFFAVSQYAMYLKGKYEILKQQTRLFNDQVYGNFMAGCQGGANDERLTIMTHMPDETEEHCRSNAREALDNFKKSQVDAE